MSELINNLSVIIVTYHGDGLLKDCLDSIHNVFGDKIEIIVVDNANQSSTCKLCSAYNRVKYIAAPENLGFAGGNNIGLKATSKDYILLLNNDTVIHEDSFSPLLDFLANNQKVGIVQGTMNIPSANVLDDCGVMMTPFGIQRHLERGKPTASTPLSPRKVFAAKGAMLMFKRKVLADTGFLFYDHFKSYYEETDFCHRAKLKGWQTWFVPTPPIDHLGGQTVGKIPSEEVWSQYFANIIYSFRKNFGFWGHIFTLPCFVIAAFLHSPKILIRAFGMQHDKTNRILRRPLYSLSYLQSWFPNRRFPEVKESQSKDVKIFVMQHRDEKLPRYFSNTSIYTPLFCGKNLNPKSTDILCDNCGENISAYNKYLNELSGIYWVAKHYQEIGNPDYIGFAHYRRSLDWKPKKLKPNVVFANYYAGLQTVGNALKTMHTPFAIDLFLPIFKETFGKQYDDIDKFLWNNHTFYICNIFITDKTTFFRYFDFLEKCIKIAISLIDSHRDELDCMGNRQCRAFGFLLERFTGYWFWHEKRCKNLKIIPSRLRHYAIANLENSNH